MPTSAYPFGLPCNIPGLALAPAPGIVVGEARQVSGLERVTIVGVANADSEVPEMHCISAVTPGYVSQTGVYLIPGAEVLLDLLHETGDFLARRWLATRLQEDTAEWDLDPGCSAYRMGETVFREERGPRDRDGFFVKTPGITSTPVAVMQSSGPDPRKGHRAWALRCAVFAVVTRDAVEGERS